MLIAVSSTQVRGRAFCATAIAFHWHAIMKLTCSAKLLTVCTKVQPKYTKVIWRKGGNSSIPPVSAQSLKMSCWSLLMLLSSHACTLAVCNLSAMISATRADNTRPMAKPKRDSPRPPDKTIVFKSS